MRYGFLCALVLLAAPAAAPAQDDDALALARDILDRGAAPFDTRDAAAMAATYVEDGEIILIKRDSDTDRITLETTRGRAAIEKGYADLFRDRQPDHRSRNTVASARFLGRDLLLIEGRFALNRGWRRRRIRPDPRPRRGPVEGRDHATDGAAPLGPRALPSAGWPWRSGGRGGVFDAGCHWRPTWFGGLHVRWRAASATRPLSRRRPHLDRRPRARGGGAARPGRGGGGSRRSRRCPRRYSCSRERSGAASRRSASRGSPAPRPSSASRPSRRPRRPPGRAR